jgi:5,10-methylenetetrahydromethanopterin reductase
MTNIEFWRLTHYKHERGAIATAARQAEDDGWTGIGIGDSHHLTGDTYVGMALAAQATERLKVASSVTNPFTRHAAITANAIATVQNESGGRATLGIGRGDSALAYLGLATAPVSLLREYLTVVQAYLRGEAVAFSEDEGKGRVGRWSSSDGARGPTSSTILEIPPDDPKVPVSVSASGPAVIAAAAVLADEVALAVGSDIGRIGWAMDIAREARAKAGLPAEGLKFAIYVPIVVNESQSIARDLIRGAIGSYARFAVMKGDVIGPATDEQRTVLKAMHDAYDMNSHFTAGSAQSSVLNDDVIDMFGIAGPASYCVDRLNPLIELGVTKVFVLASAYGIDPEDYRKSMLAIARGVATALTS